MPNASRNIRFLLWEREIGKAEWVKLIAAWTGKDTERAEGILHDRTPSSHELEKIAKGLGLNDDQLQTVQHSDLIKEANVDILTMNLKFLLEQVNASEVARQLKIHPTTIYRWKCGQHSPSKADLRRLSKELGIEPSDMEMEPLFLSLLPVGMKAQKEWLLRKIHELNDKELQTHFESFRKILS